MRWRLRYGMQRYEAVCSWFPNVNGFIALVISRIFVFSSVGEQMVREDLKKGFERNVPCRN
jgi:hypothetical protein